MSTHKIRVLLLSVVLTLPLYAGNAKADSAQMRQLVPDVSRTRKTARTHVFARTQLIYSQGNEDYLHHWIDRPLLVDPGLDAETATTGYSFPLNESNAPAASLMSRTSYARMQQEVLDYGLDGLAFFPQTYKRAPFYDYTAQSGLAGFQLLSEFIPNDQDTGKSEVIQKALANPASFRIDGKVVITSYIADSKSAEYWQEEIAALKKQHGDTFIFLPALSYFGGEYVLHWVDKFDSNTVTPKDIATIQEYLRKWLRATDGLYFASTAAIKNKERTFEPDFYRDFIIRLMKSVLAEPEFKQKYFGLTAMVGHENNTRVGYTLSSDGTGTLRNSFEAAMDAEPEVINIPEWDEQNENTSLRPTVYNGYSSKRIMRYYTAKLRGEKLSPLPADDTSIPDLIVSYRKTLVLGEKLEIELLNVPDAEQGSSYIARLSLENVSGKTVYTSPPQTFHSTRMNAHKIIIPSELLADHQVVRPVLAIESNNRRQTFRDGLHYIDLRATWNWDYKWVKQSLRDILKPGQVGFKVSPQGADGKRIVSATYATDEPLQHVEVLDNDDVVYSYALEDNWRENAEQVIIRLSWGALSSVNMNGTIALQDATARWQLPRHNFYLPALKGQTLSFENTPATKRRRRVLLAIPRSSLGKASLQIAMPGIYQGTISLKDLMEKGIYGIPGPRGFNLVISRYLSQDKIPLPVNAKSVQFEVPILPRLSNSVLHLQAIGKSGRIYRSKPIVLQSPNTSKTQISVYSETKKEPLKLDVDSDRVPDIRYQFDPSRGTTLVADAGRPFWGIAGGGYLGQVTGRGGGNAGDDSPFLAGRGLPGDTRKTAPGWVKAEDGEYSLQFNGASTFISLPQGVIPRRAGFTIEMDIRPDTVTGSQLLLANRSRSTGSISVYLIEGVLKARYYGQYSGGSELLDTGLQLPTEQWSQLRISYDQEELIFLVDGKPGKTFTVKGPGVYDTASVVGGFEKNWFKGQIKNLRIRHAPI